MSATLITSFAPLGAVTAHTLILGSIPGTASLRAQQYYAHPRNVFWPIICAFLAIPHDSCYVEKTSALTAADFALWDVLGSCSRSGSLDSDILRASETLNPLIDWLTMHSSIKKILFNGAKAEAYFRLNVLPAMSDTKLSLIRLPSTSPANAMISFEEKCTIWHAALSRGSASDTAAL